MRVLHVTPSGTLRVVHLDQDHLKALQLLVEGVLRQLAAPGFHGQDTDLVAYMSDACAVAGPVNRVATRLALQLGMALDGVAEGVVRGHAVFLRVRNWDTEESLTDADLTRLRALAACSTPPPSPASAL